MHAFFAVLVGCAILLAGCDLFAPDVPPLPAEKTVSLTDPLDDLYGQGGVPATGPAWQDITELDVKRDAETVTFIMSCGGSVPQPMNDAAILILVDIDGDGSAAPADGVIDFDEGNLDYGVFIPAPGFGEPPIFIEDLELGGQGTYDTTGARFSVDADRIEIEVDLEHIGSPGGAMGFVAALRTGITGLTVEDRIPNEGLGSIERP
jgi:hypothetical protein